jgi:hypothetical protein
MPLRTADHWGQYIQSGDCGPIEFLIVGMYDHADQFHCCAINKTIDGMAKYGYTANFAVLLGNSATSAGSTAASQEQCRYRHGKISVNRLVTNKSCISLIKLAGLYCVYDPYRNLLDIDVNRFARVFLCIACIQQRSVE